MKDFLIFVAIVLFGLIPFGFSVVWTLYRKTIVFPAAMLIFISSMFCSIVAFAVSAFGFNSLYWAIPTCFVFLISTNFFVKKIIRMPLRDIRLIMDEAATGNLNLQLDPRTLKPAHEVGSIARSFQKLIQSLHKIDAFANEIGHNNLNINYELLSENDQIGKSLLNMRESLLQAQELEQLRKIKDDEETWANQGIAKFSDILRANSENQNKLTIRFISELVNYLGIVQGAVFIINEDNDQDVYYEMKAAVAYNRQKVIEKQFRIGESLVGRCAFEKLPIYMTEVPHDYIKITSGLGEANPGCIALIPALMDSKVYAVVELVSFKPLKPYEIKFITHLGENLASTLSTVRIHERTAILLQQSQAQKEELSAQEEEMRQNMEELLATQEQMARRESQLKQIMIEFGIDEAAIQTKLNDLELS